MSFWDVIWFIIVAYAFFAYLLIFFRVVADIFRDGELGGFAKALWLLALVFAPFLSLLVYVIARGRSMSERAVADMQAARSKQEEAIREIVGPVTPAAQIAQAKGLLDSGAIDLTEYDRLKQHALA